MIEVLMGLIIIYFVCSIFYLDEPADETPKIFVPGIFIIVIAGILFVVFIAGSLAWKLLQLIGQITLEAFV